MSERVVFWRELIGRQAESGVTVDEFCRRQQVSPSSFYDWRRRLAGAAQRRGVAEPTGTTQPKRSAEQASLGKPARSARPATPRFLPVHVAEVALSNEQSSTEPSAPRPAVELERADGIRIRVFDGAQRQTISDVLAALDTVVEGDRG
jgi:transposase-like protein